MANLLSDTQPDTEEPLAVNITPEVKEESSLSSNVTACTAFHAKPALNRRTRRRLAREINSVNYHVRHSSVSKPIVELRKYMARPPGCSFLGAKATETTATIGGLDTDPISVIVDSGSDITLISQKALENLSNMPRTKAEQRIDLIQVTGKSIISGYITLDLFLACLRDMVSRPPEKCAPLQQLTLWIMRFISETQDLKRTRNGEDIPRETK
jgi:hypothetical protein